MIIAVLLAARAQIDKLNVELAENEKENDHALKQLDRVLTERDAALVELNQARGERDEAWRVAEIWRNDAIRERDAAVKERDTALANLSQMRAERNKWQGAYERARDREDNARIATSRVKVERDAAVKRAEALQVERDNAECQAAEWQRAANEHEQDEIAAVKRAEAAEAQLAKIRQDRDTIDQMREENARLKAQLLPHTEQTQCVHVDAIDRLEVILGRAVAALQETRDAIGAAGPNIVEGFLQLATGELDQDIGKKVLARMLAARDSADVILADTTATQAADAWRAQQEERQELETVYEIGRTIELPCICHVTDGECTGCRFRKAWRLVDARRGGK